MKEIKVTIISKCGEILTNLLFKFLEYHGINEDAMKLSSKGILLQGP